MQSGAEPKQKRHAKACLFYLVDSKGIEPSTSAMRKDFVNFFGLFLLLLAVSAGFNFICKPL